MKDIEIVELQELKNVWNRVGRNSPSQETVKLMHKINELIIQVNKLKKIVI